MENAPGARVVILTASIEEKAAVEAVAAGATGYLQKETGRDRLLSTVRDVAAGELRVPAEVVTRVFAGIRPGAVSEDAAGMAGLTQSRVTGCFDWAGLGDLHFGTVPIPTIPVSRKS